jgi:excinuclease ABC subunit C
MEVDHPARSTQRLNEVRALIKRFLPEDPFFFDSSRYPLSPGCYLMKDRRGTVVYVGKAKNLRDRLCSYFHSQHKDGRIARMVQRVRSIEVILVNNEWESLVLENNLIKHYKPHYNARLVSDDSGYSYIIQTTEKYPRLLPYTRNGYNKEIERIQGDAIEKRFGPFLSRRFRDILLEFVVDYFGFRTCSPLPKRVCLRHEIKRCCGACANLVSPEAYSARLAEAAVFLSYEKAVMVDFALGEMKRRMLAHAARLEFESAQRIRDQIEAMERIRVKQIVERHLPYDQDVIYFGEGSLLLMRLQKGAVLKLSEYEVKRSERAREAFLIRHYKKNSPQEIVVNLEMDLERAARSISAKNGYPVNILRAVTEDASDLMALCKMNLEYRQGNQRA